MGCGCGRKKGLKKISNSKKKTIKKRGNTVRKKRLTRLISSPGRVPSSSVKK
jgi:hypothetical protein